MADERTRTQESEPSPKSRYDQTFDEYRKVRERAENPYVVRGSEQPWETNRQGELKYYSHPTIEDAVLPEMKVFKHQIRSSSGRHTHQGGFTIFGIGGEGETLVGDERISWGKGDMVALPFQPGGVEHQHFNQNDPDNPATWLAINWNPFLNHVGAMFKQNESSQSWDDDDEHDHQEDDDDSPLVADEFKDFTYDDYADYEPRDPETLYGDLIDRRNRYRKQMVRAKEAGNWAKVTSDQLEWEWTPQGKLKWYIHPAYDDRSMMSLIASMQEIPPGSRSGKQHRQGGLVHYVLEGEGHSIIDGERYEWEAHDYIGLPVKPAGLSVQHFNDDPENPVKLIRAEPFLQEALGYDLGCGFKQLESCPEYDGPDVETDWI